MKHVSTLVINVNLLMDDVLWCTSLGHQVQGNVLESEVAGNIKWRPSELISFNNELKYIVLTLNNSFIVAIIILIKLRSEPFHD